MKLNYSVELLFLKPQDFLIVIGKHNLNIVGGLRTKKKLESPYLKKKIFKNPHWKSVGIKLGFDLVCFELIDRTLRLTEQIYADILTK